MSEKLDFGKKLIAVRKVRGLTQEEVAEKCKITVRTIQRIESGIVKPRDYTIKIISKALGFEFFHNSNIENYTQNFSQHFESGKHTILWYLKDLFNLKTNTMKKVSILVVSILAIGIASFIFVSEMVAQSDNEEIIENLSIKLNGDNTISKIEVAFTNNLTIDNLVDIKNELRDIGITINYQNIEFDTNDKLSAIRCKVDCNDGFKGGFAVGNLNSLNKDKRIGFYRDYSKKSNPFGTGGLKL